MAKEREELTFNQKALLTVAGRTSTHDWEHNLGDERLRMSRVMVGKLIRLGGDDVLRIVAEYLGTQIVTDSEIEELVAKWEKAPYDGDKFELARKALLRSKKISYF